MIRGPLPSCAGGTQSPRNPSVRVETGGDRWRRGGLRQRARKEEREKKGREGGSPGSDPQKKEGLESSQGDGERGGGPCLCHIPSPLHTHTHTLGTRQVCGYVVGLSGLLTGLPPFITAGSLVLLLGGTAALGTVSPTSCNDGSLYMATSNGLGRK